MEQGQRRVTSSNFDMVMRVRDWARFGEYIIQQMSNDTSLRKLFKYGLKQVVPTKYLDHKPEKYTIMSWVQDINGSPSSTVRGRAG